jgi:hypothetical protein
MSQKNRWIKFSGLIISALFVGACFLTTPEATPTPDLRTPMALTEQAAEKTQEAKSAESTASAKEAEEAAATSAAQANMDNTATAASEATSEAFTQETEMAAKETEQAVLDAEATANAIPTDTPIPTQTKTRTPLPPPLYTNTPAAAVPPASGMIVRGPGEKSAGDHGVSVKNKTGSNVTIYMYGDPFDYTFYVPDGNHKIYVRPGNYSFTIFACGGQSTGSGVFNSNWVWTFSCK